MGDITFRSCGARIRSTLRSINISPLRGSPVFPSHYFFVVLAAVALGFAVGAGFAVGVSVFGVDRDLI